MKTLKVRDLLPYSRSAPGVVSGAATLREVVEKLVEDPITREVYVVDEEGRFEGLITVQRLARFVFSALLPDRSSATELLDIVSAKTATDVALRKAVCVQEDDSFEHVIEVMLRFDLNEIPVVNSDHVIVGSLDLLEILGAWHEGRVRIDDP